MKKMNEERIDWDKRIGLPDHITLDKDRQIHSANTPVIKSVCDQCRFENECRFKAENVEQNCKFFIDKQTVL